MRFPKPVRSVLAVPLVAALAVSCQSSSGPAEGAAPASKSSFMQIVAHQDDDILFMNPDLTRQYRDPSVTVYLTGGETIDPRFPDTCAYSASRDAGAKAAHAQMAGVADPTWTAAPLKLGNGKTVEVDALDQAPQVKLVFMRLHARGDRNWVTKDTGQANLAELYAFGKAKSLRESTLGSLPVDGKCNRTYAHQQFSRADLVASLTDLMQHFQPTVVLAQDPKVEDGYSRDTTDLGDHSDHIGGARFVAEAARGYHGPGGNRHFLLRHYRDYNIRLDPENVPPALAEEKKHTFLTYLGPDRHTGEHYSGRLDPQPNPEEPPFYAMFPGRQYPRWWSGTSWSALDRGGLLNAFAVLDGHVQAWRETESGGAWSGPDAIPGGKAMAPTLGVLKDRDGLIHLFGIRLRDSRIVTVAQTASGAWGAWTVLGNPDQGDPQYVGAPAPALDRDGRLTVFVRNAGGGVSATSQRPDGSWPGTWTDLGGTWVRDGLTATTASDGRIELFAPSKDGIRHWRQNESGAFTQDGALLGPAPAGPITAGRRADGRLAVFYHQAGTTRTVTQYVRADGTWTSAPTPLGGPAGTDGVAVATSGDGRIAVAVRNGGGGVSTVSQSGPDQLLGLTWSDLGFGIIGAPTVAFDGAGRQVVLALGRDAALHVIRQSAPGAGSPFGPWQQAGD
ncbi:hypothetical protein ACFY20_02515 [Streptomyces sp. NPDC001312]|uniref:hypothetical protein n=1 Tax=Streptomyces sp. NPDC001312 TaxID=3364561 RepID=UPI003685FA69